VISLFQGCKSTSFLEQEVMMQWQWDVNDMMILGQKISSSNIEDLSNVAILDLGMQ